MNPTIAKIMKWEKVKRIIMISQVLLVVLCFISIHFLGYYDSDLWVAVSWTIWGIFAFSLILYIYVRYFSIDRLVDEEFKRAEKDGNDPDFNYDKYADA